jgi:hypothetical protein
MAEGNSGILTAMIAGLAALAGTIGGTWIKKDTDIELARQKFYSDLVMKSLEQKTGQERIEMLKMLTKTHLISDAEVRKGIESYADSTKPENVPQVVPSGTNPPVPIVPDARVFLLAGSPQKAATFNSVKNELATAKYRVMDAKVLVDPGRPDSSEIRYFNIQDQTQAEQLAEYMNFKDSKNPFPAKRYQDSTAKPGYIEIWFGR